MTFKRTTLAILIPVLSLGLVGCNSSSESNTPEVEKKKITATFIDSAVGGLKYECSEGENGLTNNKGEFTVYDGSSCKFSINDLLIGESVVSSTEDVITPYHIASTVKKAITIAAILQSIDSDGDADTAGIDLTQFDGKLPKNILEQDEIQIEETLIAAGIEPENIVSFDEAKEHLDEHTEPKGYHSEKVEFIINDLITITPDIHEVNYETKLAEYKDTLEDGDDSNNADIDVLKSVIEIAEVLNNEHIQKRITLSYENTPEGDIFEHFLSKAIDYAINRTPELIIKGEFDSALQSTDEEAKLFFELANRLITASDKLGQSFTRSDRVAEYSKDNDDYHLTYQDAQTMRTVALGAASMLSTIAAYNAGSDENYLMQTEENVTVKASKFGSIIIEDQDYSEWGYIGESDYTVDSVEYEKTSAYPSEFIEDNQDVFSLREDPKYLNTALKALRDAINIAQTKVDTSEYLTKEEQEDLVKLDKHLQSSDTNSLFEYKTETVSAKLNIKAAYDFNTAIQRSDLNIIENNYDCVLDDEMTKLSNSPTCYEEKYQGNFLSNDDQGDDDYSNYITYFLSGKPATHNLEIKIKNNKLSNIITECTEKNATGETVTCDILSLQQND